MSNDGTEDTINRTDHVYDIAASGRSYSSTHSPGTLDQDMMGTTTDAHHDHDEINSADLAHSHPSEKTDQHELTGHVPHHVSTTLFVDGYPPSMIPHPTQQPADHMVDSKVDEVDLISESNECTARKHNNHVFQHQKSHHDGGSSHSPSSRGSHFDHDNDDIDTPTPMVVQTELNRLQWPSQDQWMKASACSRCGKQFTLFTRQHHCRPCGRSVCNRCSKHRVFNRSISKQSVRACKSCYDVIMNADLFEKGVDPSGYKHYLLEQKPDMDDPDGVSLSMSSCSTTSPIHCSTPDAEEHQHAIPSRQTLFSERFTPVAVDVQSHSPHSYSGDIDGILLSTRARQRRRQKRFSGGSQTPIGSASPSTYTVESHSASQSYSPTSTVSNSSKSQKRTNAVYSLSVYDRQPSHSSRRDSGG